MAKSPVKVGKETFEIQEFVDGDERVLQIDDRFYRAWSIPGSNRFYCMVKVGDHPRSIQGTRDQILELLARVHQIYRDYENKVRNQKELAQRDRDRRLNELSNPPIEKKS